MNLTLTSFGIYTLFSLSMVILVGTVLFKNGKVFLFDIFKGDTELTEAVNRLLLIGFYLINFGYILINYNFAKAIGNWIELLQKLSSELGIIIFSLGIIHMINIFFLMKMRKKSSEDSIINSLKTENPEK